MLSEKERARATSAPASARDERIRRGVELFNGHEFWHAHEAWEEVWLRAEGDEKQFLQGLIQLAAAYHHVKRGTSPRGAVRLFDAALRRLQPFPEGHRKVSRTDACATAAVHRERIVNGERIEPDQYPKLGYN
jgi:predicted metal-dependent hydrolase